jgi:predicted acylesterase/phospholipase RssA
MYGFLDRLWIWLQRAAMGTLDAVGGPAHPPVVMPSGDGPLVVVRADTPIVRDEPWIGWAQMERVHARRVDITGWISIDDEIPERDAFPVVLLPGAMDFYYPTTVWGLAKALIDREVSHTLMALLASVGAHMADDGDEMLFAVGSAMRGTVGEHLEQHVAIWTISAEELAGLRAAIPPSKGKDRESKEEWGKRFDAFFEWSRKASINWCRVSEARPQLIKARDAGSPMEPFRGKSFSVWGCGAIGGHVAELLVRAGASRLVLHDNDVVTPGVLVRQPFTDLEIGRYKAECLAERLSKIFPDCDIAGAWSNVLTGPLGGGPWDDGCDFVIDATASTLVASKFEFIRRVVPSAATCISMILGHTATHGIATFVPPQYSGAGRDVHRATHLASISNPRMRGIQEEFWPGEPRSDYFQPEPGCSDPTFIGSAADVASLAATLLNRLGNELRAPSKDAVVHTANMDPVAASSAFSRIQIPAAIRLEDGVGDYEVRLSKSAHAELRANIRAAWRARGEELETGGLLFGLRDDAAKVLWIDGVSGPPSDSTFAADGFVCGTEGCADLIAHKKHVTQGELNFVGLWHTHPAGPPHPSDRDLATMLTAIGFGDRPLPFACMLIVGRDAGRESLGAYVYSRDDLPKPITVVMPKPMSQMVATLPPPTRDIGLALSGGGSRAIAFHLGCLRALHDRGLTDRVKALSCVSGGSVIGAMWAYSDGDFERFEAAVLELLAAGLQWQIIGKAIFSNNLARTAASTMLYGAGSARRRLPMGSDARPIRRFSRTHVFCELLQDKLFGDTKLAGCRHADFDVVINSCDLRTGSAARFGSAGSAIGRTRISEDIQVATAVAASAAYPLLLPTLNLDLAIEGREDTKTRAILSDGGIYDNSGVSCFDPRFDPSTPIGHFEVDYVIACDAGAGRLTEAYPAWMKGRVFRAFSASYRKAQDATRARLHAMSESGEIAGFLMPYLGQREASLPYIPSDLVLRDSVVDYPTDFAPMSRRDTERLSLRGEQLTRMLIERWCPEL